MTRWNIPGVPHKGWTCLAVEDLETTGGTCGMCGNHIRYAHIMQHPEWPDSLSVGCICSAKMAEEPVEVARAREKPIRRKKAKPRQPSKFWKLSQKGNWTYFRLGYRATIFGLLKVGIHNPDEPFKVLPDIFTELDAAKIFAEDFVNSLVFANAINLTPVAPEPLDFDSVAPEPLNFGD
jgi:hypothetical protein